MTINEMRQLLTDGLINALQRQRQIDEDGCEVGVSREAVEQSITLLSTFPDLLRIAESASVLEQVLHACITDEEIEVKGTSLGSDLVADALNKVRLNLSALTASGPRIVCAGCGVPVDGIKPVCDDCLAAEWI